MFFSSENLMSIYLCDIAYSFHAVQVLLRVEFLGLSLFPGCMLACCSPCRPPGRGRDWARPPLSHPAPMRMFQICVYSVLLWWPSLRIFMTWYYEIFNSSFCYIKQHRFKTLQTLRFLKIRLICITKPTRTTENENYFSMIHKSKFVLN
jgi:hypothetical protein